MKQKNTKKIFKKKFDIDIDELCVKTRKGLEDIENNHDRSWTLDLYEKNKNNLYRNAIFVRGTKITYKELFNQAEIYADIFQKMGINEESEVPMCVSYCPEFIYSLLAINLLGAKVNIFGEYDKDYMTEIINDCNCDFIICTDNNYEHVRDSIVRSKVNKVLMFSLTDSLIDNEDKLFDIELEILHDVFGISIKEIIANYKMENKVSKYKDKDILEIMDISEFKSIGDKSLSKKITDYDIGNINTEFLVTYSSGSTSRPKPIVHTNRSLITMGRFQDPDLSGLPEMNDLVGLALIPPHSNTGVITSMSDVLYKGCTVALEHIYDPKFFITSLLINKANYVAAPRNMIVIAMKMLYEDKNYSKINLPYMMMLTSVGEPTSKGEEKFINKILRKVKCGSKKLPAPISPVPLSIGGGDCERGGMFFTSYRAYQDLNPKFSLTGQRCNLKPYSMVQVAVMDKEKNILSNGEDGILITKTPTQMSHYKNNEKATRATFVHTKDSQRWCNCNTYARIDQFNTVNILGRVGNEIILEDGNNLPLYRIGEIVEVDTKNILSYEVINVNNVPIIHIEFQPNMKKNKKEVLIGIEKRIAKALGKDIASKIIYRVRHFNEDFPATKCQKRSYDQLVAEGISDKCIKPIYNGTDYEFILASDYLKILDNYKVLKKSLF